MVARWDGSLRNLRSIQRVTFLLLAVLSAWGVPRTAQAAAPENLARTATAAATSEHNTSYLAKYAIDGRIPPAGSATADLNAAWCVLKAKTGDAADFTLAWQTPQEIAEIVYFGRTAWYVSECFKDYEIYLDDVAEPVARGTLAMVHGPQSIRLTPARAGRLTIKFLNSYGGPNPGAAEIMVFAKPLDKKELAGLHKLAGSLDEGFANDVDPPSLRALILALKTAHRDNYPQADDHLRQLQRLETAGDEEAADRLAELQRAALLFDVDRLLVIKRHEITASHVYTYHYEGQRDGGGLYVISPHEPESQSVQLVDSSDGQILDCDLSYDATKVLFSWRRRSGEGYHLWTVNVDGSGLTQLTEGEWHDYNGCWLPDGGIGFLSTRAPQFAYCWHAPVGVLHRMEADGSEVRRLSANYLNDFTPVVMDDGRIIYSRWEYVDRPAIPIQSLWTINPDGTGLAGYFGNRVLSPGTFMEARQIPGTTKIVCTMTGHNGPTRGAIGIVDRTKGVNAQAAIENITPDVPVPAVDQGNGNTDGSKLYSSPVPLDGQRLLLSARGPVLVRDLAGTCQSVALARPADGMQYFNALPVRPRPRPPAIPQHQPAESGSPLATVYLQDVYNGLEPAVARGEVKTIRVVRELQKTVRIDPSLRAFGFQFPVISCGATYAGKEVIGDVEVQSDGSACFQVPAGVPLYFMALDAQGRAVQRMRSFTHFMPGEVQGCIGCHEHRLESPRTLMSDYSLPGQKGDGPLLPERPEGCFAQKGTVPFLSAVTLAPPEWGPGGFDYSTVVQPVLDQHCVRCHHPHDKQGGVDLSGDKTDFFNVSYDVLARENQGRAGSPFVSWIPTYNGHEQNILRIEPKSWGSPQSRLAELILNGHPDRDGQPQVRLNDTERRRIFAWIDLNVPYYGSSETAHPTAPGCRQMMPADLDQVLAEVAQRRCVACHAEGKFPRHVWTRVTNPQHNSFLLAPLAKAAGGTEHCGTAVFADTNDTDYRAILATFEPIERLLEKTPRMDMPGAQPSPEVNRCCQ
ncbi:MAG: hypothetical protein KJ000_06360 [Pirellulaceae bacterium]|nr:hypothetical protein [Pirellulaceae bacterium]